METLWHTKESEEVLKIIGSRESGLTESEAKSKFYEFGKNTLPEARPDSFALIFFRQFQNPLIYILIVACVIVFAIGEITDAVVILAVLILNAIVGGIQEGKAQNTLLALKRFVNTEAVVVRGGREIIVKDFEIVPGDILILSEGEKVPADARIISVNNLKVDEAALTGESLAIEKISDYIEKKVALLPEQRNMLFKGTSIVAGEAKAVVVSTGLDTAIGKIAKKISSIESEIPLKANLRNLSKLMIIATVIISIFIFAIGIREGNTAIEMFTTVVSVAVSVIPEGLPIALTLILATGVWRMSKKNALVKRLQAVEALGQAQVIAVDKTGTLTKNEMVVQEVYIDKKVYGISGVGYTPQGEVKLDNKAINPPEHTSLLLAGKIATYCADARIMYNEDTKDWKVAGDPTEAALLILGQKLGFKKESLENSSPVVGEIPFAHDTKYHVMVHQEDSKFMTVVGAPEDVLELSTSIWENNSERAFETGELEKVKAELYSMSSKGLRVLAFAFTKEVPDDLNPKNVKNLTFAGFYGMKDALREEVKMSAKKAQDAGIRVVMITGDHKATAEAIAREAGIFREGDGVLTGIDIDKMSPQSLKDALSTTTVFARVTPEHKLDIIKAFKSRGEVVAMTGDGVNDAPSLVAADLGVSMGKIGTEVAKEASDIILLDDDFGTIVTAIEEGRSIYKTIRKVVLYLVSTSIGEVLVIGGALLLGWPLPILATQIIWLNFVTDGFFNVALAMEPKDKNLLKERAEKPAKYLIDRSMTIRMTLMSLTMMVGTMILFSEYYTTDIVKGWTMTLTTLAVFQWFNAWNCRSENKSVFAMNPFENKYMIPATIAAIVCQILAVHLPFFNTYLKTTPLSLEEWILAITFAASIIVVEETRKLLTGLVRFTTNKQWKTKFSS